MPAYQSAMLRAYRTGKDHPFLFDTVWDVMRLIDYLETRQDVDALRIGLTGISKGGMEAYLAAAADCAACHTAPGGAPFAGGLPMQSGFGTIYATNITPDPDDGGCHVIPATVRATILKQ